MYRTPSNRPQAVQLLAGLLLLGLAAGAPAQTEKPDEVGARIITSMSAEQKDARAGELLELIHKTYATGEADLRRLETASTEDSLVLRNRLASLRVRIVGYLHELADLLLSFEQTDQAGEHADLRAQLEELFPSSSERFWYHINRYRQVIDEERAKRQELSAGEWPALEHDIAMLTERLDRLVELASVHLQKSEALGLDTTAEQADFVALLEERPRNSSPGSSSAICASRPSTRGSRKHRTTPTPRPCSRLPARASRSTRRAPR
jgi:hypothetical protein